MHQQLLSKALVLQAVAVFLLGSCLTGLSASRKPINTVPKDGFDFNAPAPAAEPAKAAPLKETTASAQDTNGKASAPITRSSKKVVARQEASPATPADTELTLPKSSDGRFWQLRGGPRMAKIYGKLRPGMEGGSYLDLPEGFGLSDTDFGPQLDLDLRFSDRAYGRLIFTSDTFEGSVLTDRPINYVFSRGSNPATQQNPIVLPAGSPMNTKLEMNLLQTVIGYDIYRNDTVTFGALVGAKSVFTDINFHVANGATPYDRTISLSEVTPLVGVELRVQFNPHLYFGLTPVGFGWENYSYVGGQGYFGYDFNRHFGMRLGMDFDHLTTSRSTGPTYAISDATLAAVFLQGVFGY
jgi:hypothetical protein